MPTYKRIDGDYTITTINSADNVIVTTNTLEVRGNLDVSGNLTYINVEELNVRDPFIVLNSSNTGSYAANSGLLVHRTTTNYAGLRWSNNAVRWQVANSTSSSGETGTWANILTDDTGQAAAGANTEIQYNFNGVFGASANLRFDQSLDQLTIQGQEVLGLLAADPTGTVNGVTIWHRAAGSGGTGIYFRENTGPVDELISREKAVLYSIIF